MIDPFAVVEVTFDGGESFEDVPVIGVDAFADVAVLGPITTDRKGLRLEPVPDFDVSAEPEVFLVGYPGGIEDDDPNITLSGGLLSRMREDAGLGYTYLQTDAAISGGQSGGALVDADGRVLGISGLGFAEEFALALSSDDVAAAVERIRRGEGDERRVFPGQAEAGTEAVDVELTDARPARLVLIPATDERREVLLTVDSDGPVAVEAFTGIGEPLGFNDVALELVDAFADEFGGMDPGLPPIPELDETDPGTYAFEVPMGESVVATLGKADVGVAATVDVDVPFAVLDATLEAGEVTVGAPARGVLDGFSFEAEHTIELVEGDEVEITVRGAPATRSSRSSDRTRSGTRSPCRRGTTGPVASTTSIPVRRSRSRSPERTACSSARTTGSSAATS
ncbi:hypothetical protein BH18ACT2_BH18ACT2_09150 [soil metagenome]